MYDSHMTICFGISLKVGSELNNQKRPMDHIEQRQNVFIIIIWLKDVFAYIYTITIMYLYTLLSIVVCILESKMTTFDQK